MGQLYSGLGANVTDDWMTPPDILSALGPFDLDPCAVPEPRPWPTAARHIARPDDGLTAPWTGRVWLNPPYSTAGTWVGRLAAHGRGTALIFARTDSRWFADYVWAQATGLLFLPVRLRFVRAGQTRATRQPAPAPAVLAAYGDDDARWLAGSDLGGAYVHGWNAASKGSDQEALFALAD